MLLQRLLPHHELKPGEEAETNLEPRELRLAHAADLGHLGVRVREVLEGLHGDAQPREDEPVRVAARHGDGALLDGEAVDVEGRREVHGRAHRAELVQAEKVLADADGGFVFAVEFARDGAVLEVEGLGVGADDDVRLWFPRRRRRGIRGSLPQTHPIDILSHILLLLLLLYLQARQLLLLPPPFRQPPRIHLGLLPQPREALLGMRAHNVGLFGVHGAHVRHGGGFRGRGRRDVARELDEELDAGGEHAEGLGGRELEEVVVVRVYECGGGFILDDGEGGIGGRDGGWRWRIGGISMSESYRRTAVGMLRLDGRGRGLFRHGSFLRHFFLLPLFLFCLFCVALCYVFWNGDLVQGLLCKCVDRPSGC